MERRRKTGEDQRKSGDYLRPTMSKQTINKLTNAHSNLRVFQIILIIILNLIEFNLASQFSSNHAFSSNLKGGDDEELVKTMDRSNEDEFTINLSNQLPPDESHQSATSSLTQPDQQQEESNGLGAELRNPTKSEEEFASQAEPSEMEQQMINARNNQSNIVLSDAGNHNIDKTNNGGQRFAAGLVLHNRNGSSIAPLTNQKDEPKFPVTFSEDNLAANPPKRQTTNASRWEFEPKQLKLEPNNLESGAHIRVKKGKKRRRKKKKMAEGSRGYPAWSNRLNENLSPESRWNGALSSKMISYSAMNPLREQQYLMANSVPMASGSELRPEFGGQMERTKQPAVFSGKQIRLIAHKPLHGHHDLNGGLLSQASGDSFMFDASLLPPALKHLFPSAAAATSLASPETTSQTSYQGLAAKDSTKPLFELTKQGSSTRDNDSEKIIVNEYLSTSSSQPSSEFETTLKQQPEQQQDPIVTDVGSEASASDSNSSQSPPSSSGKPGEDSGDDDEDDDLELDGIRDPVYNASGSSREATLMGVAGESRLQSGGGGIGGLSSVSSRLEIRPMVSVKSTNSNANRAQPTNRDGEHELLVGPFRSESEAPATITLSGIVYQKSGSSSSFVKSGLINGRPDSNGGKENLSASGSSSASTTNASGHQNMHSSPGPLLMSLSAASSNAPEKYWPYSSSLYLPHLLASPPLASISDILLGSIKSASVDLEPAKDPSTGSLQLPAGAYPTSLSGGIRLSPFPFSPAALRSSLSGSFATIGDQQQQHLNLASGDELALLNPPKQMLAALKGAQNSKETALASGSSSATLLDTPLGPITSASSLAQEQAPIWAAKKGEQYYLGAASESSYSSKEKDKTGPIVIVQKDVKPVKYHLLRAYLKLRRLLRPFEATYVFPNDSQTFFGRRQQTSAPTLAKVTRGLRNLSKTR